MPYGQLQLGEWRPDFGEWGGSHLYYVKGAIPAGGVWTPAPNWSMDQLVDVSGTLPDTPWGYPDVYGLHLHKTTSDFTSFYAYVGGSDGIMRNNGASLTTQVAMSAAVANGPDTTSGWQFTSYGNQVWATDFNDAILYASTPTTNFAAGLTTSTPTTYAPMARFISTIKNHLLIANIKFSSAPSTSITSSALTGTSYPNLVMWSATDNPRRFGDPSAIQDDVVTGSDYQPLDDEHGPITGLVGGDYAYIFKTNAIYRMDGPPFTIRPIVIGSGTRYPNSIVRYYDDVYYWGPSGPTRLRAGSSEPEILGLGKISRTVTEFQNASLRDLVFERESDFTVTNLHASSPLETNPIDISACADHRAGLIIFSCHDRMYDEDDGFFYQSPILVYDTVSERFGHTYIGQSGFGIRAAYLRALPRYGQNPWQDNAKPYEGTAHSVMDGVVCIVGAEPTGSSAALLSNTYGDSDTGIISGGNYGSLDTKRGNWMEFRLPYQQLAEDQATKIKKLRIQFLLDRFGTAIGESYTTAGAANLGDLRVTVRWRVYSRNRAFDTAHDTGNIDFASDDTTWQGSSGWVDINSVAALYHSIYLRIEADFNGTPANIPGGVGPTVHLRSLGPIEVEYEAKGKKGSTYSA